MIEFDEVSFTYPDSPSPAIRGVDLGIEQGEYVVAAGPSGSGKSTFLRCMNGLIPHFYGGAFAGKVSVGGLDTTTSSVRELARVVGLVFQDPENQFVTSSIGSELEFGLYNLGGNPEEVDRRASELSKEFELQELLEKPPAEISGGEKQRAIIASVVAMGTKAIALDEPTSQLDPFSASQILELLRKLNAGGMTVVLTEHRLKRCLKDASRCLVFNSGGVVLDGSPEDLVSAFPELVRLPSARQGHAGSEGNRVEIRRLSFRYPGQVNWTLRNLSVTIMKSSLVGVMARNGGGKTTLARILAGLLGPYEGQIQLDGHDLRRIGNSQLSRLVGIVFQDPNIHLFHDTVREEVEFARKNMALGDGTKVDTLLGELGLLEVDSRNPRDLSGGQKEKVAIAGVMSYEPELLILDEPTRGLDVMEKAAVMGAVRKMIEKKGTTVMVLTHDLEMIEAFADSAVVISNGAISFQGSPSEAVKRFMEA